MKLIFQTSRISVVALAGLFTLILSSCTAPFLPRVADVDTIIVDMPPGWYRIQIYPDGSGAYGFGALPEMGSIHRGTFDFEKIFKDISTDLSGGNENLEAAVTIQFCVDGDGCGPLYYLEDSEYAERLLQRGFSQRTGESRLGPAMSIENLDRMWLERFPE